VLIEVKSSGRNWQHVNIFSDMDSVHVCMYVHVLCAVGGLMVYT